MNFKLDSHTFPKLLLKAQQKRSSSIPLEDGSRIAVIGGGPAGSFFSYFLLDMAERAARKIHVDIYEPRDFNAVSPVGCNMCGGVIYESLVQSLAVEGINLPQSVVQRGIEYNMLHLDTGSVRIQTPRHEKRIATTYRGTGPRGGEFNNGGFDGYLLKAAISKGAQHIQSRVTGVEWTTETSSSKPSDRLVQIKAQGVDEQAYELLAVTSGVNTALLKHFHNLEFGYIPPKTIKLLVREYRLGKKIVSKYLGPVFHAFLLGIPGLDYGAIIPKGDNMTICLLSSHGDIEPSVMDIFLNHPKVKQILPPEFSPENKACHCSPRINVMAQAQPFGDRIVFIGDSGVSRLYKDGIGATYRAAKIAASTAVFQGVSANDFKRYYLPFCRSMESDNFIGKMLFRGVSQIQKLKFVSRAILNMTSKEQQTEDTIENGMSTIMWDMLTGGALYRDVLKRALRPAFIVRFLGNSLASFFSPNGTKKSTDAISADLTSRQAETNERELNNMEPGALGTTYQDGEIIVQQGELGNCMYVIQDGMVEVLVDSGEERVVVSVLGKDQFFGEMAIFKHEVRTATVRALGPARILTVDHKNLLQRIHEDSSLAYHVMEVMSKRIDQLNNEVSQLSQLVLNHNEEKKNEHQA